MKIKTSELTGDPLNWAVEEAKGGRDHTYNPRQYGEDWVFAGPIIEQAKIGLDYYPDGGHEDGGAWGAATCEGTIHALGPTPLIAAMRCYVASKLGDDVEIPEELA